VAETLPTLTWTSPAAEQLDRQEFTATRGESIVQPFSRSSSSTKDITGHTVTVRFAATNRSQTSLKVTASVTSATAFSLALTDTHLTTLPARTWYWQAFDETDKELLSYGTLVLFENFDLADDGTVPLASLYVPTSRTISINGTSYDLSENRSWTVAAGLIAANNLSELTATAATARTNIGGTTAGQAFFTLTNPGAITFPRINADNTVSALSASDFRTAIGALSSTGITIGGAITTADDDAASGGGIDTSASAEGYAGGDIATAGGANGVGGSINTSNGGGSFIAYGDSNGTGGTVSTASGGFGSGGSINTANGGGSINTRGTGSIQFGATGTRTTVLGQAASDITVTLPATAGTLYATGGTDVAVADGGTGRSSHTAYAVICGGTTSTGAQQSIASVGTAGAALVSNGAGALPTFQRQLISSDDTVCFSWEDSSAVRLVTSTTLGTKYIYRADGIDVPVADGGTGRSTGTTAYALIATGTTETGAQQSLPAGATTEILVGGGASALPVWTTATGSGAPVRAAAPTLSGTVTVRQTGGTPGTNDLRLYNDGTVSRIESPQLVSVESTGSAAYIQAATSIFFSVGGSVRASLNTGGSAGKEIVLRLPYAGSFSWTDSQFDPGLGTVDTGITRNGAGVVQATTGGTSSGQFQAAGFRADRLASAPSSPASGTVVFYCLDADGGAKLYSKDSGGTVRSVTLS
jgi:hypothetical protein